MKQAGKRDLVDFGSVAQNDDNVNVNVNEDENKNDNVNDEKDNDLVFENNVNSDDILNDLLAPKKKKGDTHEMRGIYFEKEVVRIMDKLARNNSKGFKSALVNEAVKRVLREKGYME